MNRKHPFLFMMEWSCIFFANARIPDKKVKRVKKVNHETKHLLPTKTSFTIKTLCSTGSIIMHSSSKIIRFKELKEKLGISRSTVDRWEAQQNFPKRIKLGENSIGWSLKSIDEWIEQKSKNTPK